MLRKALTLGIVFIFALSLLAVSMITCFTYDAEADDPIPDFGHAHYDCVRNGIWLKDLHPPEMPEPWVCYWKWMTVD